MASYNKITIIGNMVRDAELRQTQSGISVTSFSVAVNEKLKDGTEEVTFIECVAYDKKAELICRYLKKGSAVFVEGKLKCRKWQDKQGNNRYSWEVLVGEVVFLTGAQNTSQDAQSGTGVAPNPYANMPSAYGGNSPAFEEVPNDGDLPF